MQSYIGHYSLQRWMAKSASRLARISSRQASIRPVRATGPHKLQSRMRHNTRYQSSYICCCSITGPLGSMAGPLNSTLELTQCLCSAEESVSKRSHGKCSIYPGRPACYHLCGVSSLCSLKHSRSRSRKHPNILVLLAALGAKRKSTRLLPETVGALLAQDQQGIEVTPSHS